MSVVETPPKLPEWDGSNIETDGRFFVIQGRHGEGKSSLLQFILCEYIRERVNDVVAFSPTESGSLDLAQMLPRSFNYNEVPNDEYLESFIKRQKFEKQKQKKDPNYRARKLAIILDDCGFDSKFLRNSKKLREIIFNQRHLGIYLFITIQYIRQLPPDLHENVDYLFQLRVGDPQSIEKSFSAFFKGILGVKYGPQMAGRERYRFQQYLKEYANAPGHALVVQKSQDPRLCYVSWPKDYTPCRLGDETYWKIAVDLDGEGEEEEEEMMIDLTRAIKLKFNI